MLLSLHGYFSCLLVRPPFQKFVSFPMKNICLCSKSYVNISSPDCAHCVVFVFSRVSCVEVRIVSHAEYMFQQQTRCEHQKPKMHSLHGSPGRVIKTMKVQMDEILMLTMFYGYFPAMCAFKNYVYSKCSQKLIRLIKAEAAIAN